MLVNFKISNIFVLLIGGMISFNSFAGGESCKGNIVATSKETGDVIISDIGAYTEDTSGTFSSGPSKKTLHAASMDQIFACIGDAVKSTTKPKRCAATNAKGGSYRTTSFWGFKEEGTKNDIQNLGDISIKAVCAKANAKGKSKITNYEIKYVPVNTEDKCNQSKTFSSKTIYDCGTSGGLSASNANIEAGKKIIFTGKYNENKDQMIDRVNKACADKYNLKGNIFKFFAEENSGLLYAQFNCVPEGKQAKRLLNK